MTTTRNHVNQYSQVKNYTGITDANPHQLVAMLLEGAMSKLSIVKGMLTRGETSRKGEIIGQVIAIIGGLRSSLDMEQGGELAENLDNLYEYMERRLVQANLKHDMDIIDEVTLLLREIKAGWDSIPQQYREAKEPGLALVP